jgi:hypothetical protein
VQLDVLEQGAEELTDIIAILSGDNAIAHGRPDEAVNELVCADASALT